MSEKQYMNEPIITDWTEDDIMNEYEKCRDKRKVSKIFCITVREVTAILKRKGIVC